MICRDSIGASEYRSIRSHKAVSWLKMSELRRSAISHCNLALQSEAVAKEEHSVSRARIEDKGAAGAREFALASAAGYTTAVTTRLAENP
jgi:hypothetical protein